MDEQSLIISIWGIFFGLMVLIIHQTSFRVIISEMEFITTGNYSYNPRPLLKKEIEKVSKILFLYSIFGTSLLLFFEVIVNLKTIIYLFAVITTFLLPSINITISELSNRNISQKTLASFTRKYFLYSVAVSILSGLATILYAKNLGITFLEDTIIVVLITSIWVLFSIWVTLRVYKRVKPYYIQTLTSEKKYRIGTVSAKFWTLVYFLIYVYLIAMFLRSFSFSDKIPILSIAFFVYIFGFFLVNMIRRIRECPPISITSNFFSVIFVIIFVYGNELWKRFFEWVGLEPDFITSLTFNIISVSLMIIILFAGILKDYPDLRKNVYYLWYELRSIIFSAARVWIAVTLFGLVWVTLLYRAEKAIFEQFILFITLWTLYFFLFSNVRRNYKRFQENHLRDAAEDGILNKKKLKQRYRRAGKSLPAWLEDKKSLS